jgi:hypothetical protein
MYPNWLISGILVLELYVHLLSLKVWLIVGNVGIGYDG